MLHTIAIHGSGFSDQEALAQAVTKSNHVLGTVAYLNEKHVVSATVVVFPTNSAGVHSTALVTILNAPQAICAELDRQLAMLEQNGPEGTPEGQPEAWLFSHGRFARIADPCTYPPNWTMSIYHQALKQQGYRREGDLFGLNRLLGPDSDEIALSFEVYVASVPEGDERETEAPRYPYRVELCLFQSDSEPPFYVSDYPSLVQLAASFASLVQAKLQVEASQDERDAERDTTSSVLPGTMSGSFRENGGASIASWG